MDRWLHLGNTTMFFHFQFGGKGRRNFFQSQTDHTDFTIPPTSGYGRVQVCMISLRLKKVSSTFTTKLKVKEHGCITKMKPPIHILTRTRRVHSSNECKPFSAVKKIIIKKTCISPGYLKL
jgi:hypothetical protein